MSAKPATTYLGTRSHFRRRLKAGPFKDGHYRNLLKRSLSHSQKEVLHRRQQLAKKTSKRSVNILLFPCYYEIDLLFSERKGFKVVHQLEDRWPRQIRICSRFLFENRILSGNPMTYFTVKSLSSEPLSTQPQGFVNYFLDLASNTFDLNRFAPR